MDLITRHARARMQQRGIRSEDLEALLAFGREIPAGRGRDLVFSTSGLGQGWPADGVVTSVGHRYRRIPR